MIYFEAIILIEWRCGTYGGLEGENRIACWAGGA